MEQLGECTDRLSVMEAFVEEMSQNATVASSYPGNIRLISTRAETEDLASRSVNFAQQHLKHHQLY